MSGQLLNAARALWKEPFAVQDPSEVLLDLAFTLGLDGDALSGITTVNDEADVYGLVPANPAVTGIIEPFPADVDYGMAAINQAWAAAWTRV